MKMTKTLAAMCGIMMAVCGCANNKVGTEASDDYWYVMSRKDGQFCEIDEVLDVDEDHREVVFKRVGTDQASAMKYSVGYLRGLCRWPDDEDIFDNFVCLLDRHVVFARPMCDCPCGHIAVANSARDIFDGSAKECTLAPCEK